ncbi:MAG: Spore protein YkvP [Elusimicrobia bacterium ADurb.Bin231]|nr:MAG: Spore protein YkvP [Elusimicrobia bacterium ADurb.Bin231]
MISGTKIIFVSMLYDYGIKDRGYSYDYYNMFNTLKKMFGESVLFFDYMTLFRQKGKQAMNAGLLDLVHAEKPDLVIFSLYQDEFIPEILTRIKEISKTLCYFWDDQWRINFSRKWAPYFSFITTPDYNGLKRWRDFGIQNVIYSPFGCNHYLWKKKDISKKYDVSFVGMYHPYREWLIKMLKKFGFDVYVVGAGWGKDKYTPYQEIIDIFNQSKINLNLSNSISYDVRYIFSSFSSAKNTLQLFKTGDKKNREQIKGRHFEIPGCGGFQISFYIEGLEHCYEIGKEIAIFEDADDLLEKVAYYLSHENEREEIASAGYLRTLEEHTYEKRIKHMLNYAGINYGK